MTKIRFPRGHAQVKATIKACAEAGVAIDYLPDAPRFRFVPADDTPRDLEAKAAYASPSRRGSFRPKPQPHMAKLKTWRPSTLDLAPMYAQPMKGDSFALTRARKAYAEGDPAALRLWLSEQARKRKEETRGLFDLQSDPASCQALAA